VIFDKAGIPCIITPLAQATLRDVWKSSGFLMESAISRCLLHISSALAHLHANGIVHYDVHEANILLYGGTDPNNPNVTFALCDMGLATSPYAPKRVAPLNVACIHLMPPEVYAANTRSYVGRTKDGMLTDMWQLGCLAFMLCTGLLTPWQKVAIDYDKLDVSDPDITSAAREHILTSLLRSIGVGAAMKFYIYATSPDRKWFLDADLVMKCYMAHPISRVSRIVNMLGTSAIRRKVANGLIRDCVMRMLDPIPGNRITARSLHTVLKDSPENEYLVNSPLTDPSNIEHLWVKIKSEMVEPCTSPLYPACVRAKIQYDPPELAVVYYKSRVNVCAQYAALDSLLYPAVFRRSNSELIELLHCLELSNVILNSIYSHNLLHNDLRYIASNAHTEVRPIRRCECCVARVVINCISAFTVAVNLIADSVPNVLYLSKLASAVWNSTIDCSSGGSYKCVSCKCKDTYTHSSLQWMESVLWRAVADVMVDLNGQCDIPTPSGIAERIMCDDTAHPLLDDQSANGSTASLAMAVVGLALSMTSTPAETAEVAAPGRLGRYCYRVAMNSRFVDAERKWNTENFEDLIERVHGALADITTANPAKTVITEAARRLGWIEGESRDRDLALVR